MNDNGGAILRALTRRFVRLPKYLRLHPGRFVSRNDRGAQREKGSYIRHVRVVPHKQAVLVAFTEARRSETGIDPYIAVVYGLSATFFPSQVGSTHWRTCSWR